MFMWYTIENNEMDNIMKLFKLNNNTISDVLSHVYVCVNYTQYCYSKLAMITIIPTPAKRAAISLRD